MRAPARLAHLTTAVLEQLGAGEARRALRTVEQGEHLLREWEATYGAGHPMMRETARAWKAAARPILTRPTMAQMGWMRGLGYVGGAFDVDRYQARKILMAKERGDTDEACRNAALGRLDRRGSVCAEDLAEAYGEDVARRTIEALRREGLVP